MTATDWKKPAVITTKASGGANNWSNPNNAKLDDNSDATVSLNGTTPGSYGLAGSAFGFTDSDVPADAWVSGIEVRFEAWKSAGANTGAIFSASSFKDVAGTPDSSELIGQALSGSRTVFTALGDGYLASGEWLGSDIHSDDFGVQIVAACLDGSATVAVDYFEIRIHFGGCAFLVFF